MVCRSMCEHARGSKPRADMNDFEHMERVARQRAAEHLVDIAYALTGGEMLELRHDGERTTVAVADEVLMIRRSTSKGERVEVSIGLSWSSPHRRGRAQAGMTPHSAPDPEDGGGGQDERPAGPLRSGGRPPLG